jgi:hypothetical protein
MLLFRWYKLELLELQKKNLKLKHNSHIKGYTGEKCETQISHCSSNPCQYGVCIDHLGGYTCQCSSGYAGLNCINRIDACLFNPCKNGICISNIPNDQIQETYFCECDYGYEGVNCENEADLCLINNGGCLNNAVCVQPRAGFAYCDCKEGFIGRYCETVINKCEYVNCYNGGKDYFQA